MFLGFLFKNQLINIENNKNKMVDEHSQIPFSNDPTGEVLELKIAVLGKSLVGKSALTYRFISDKFPTEHDTTIEDQYKINSTIDDHNCRLEILDTAGQDDYQSMLDTWIGFAEGFVLVYSIDDRESFESLKSKYDRIVKNKGDDIYSIIIVGNKCDLTDKRKVTLEEGQVYANSKGVDFLEASALKTINVKETFVTLAHNLLNKKVKPVKPAATDRCCLCF